MNVASPGVNLLTATTHLDATPAREHADLFVFFLVGVLAGAHCLGMCGPLVTIYADRFARSRSGAGRDARTSHLTLYEVRQHALFNLERAGGYAVVGAFASLSGALAFSSSDVLAAGDAVRGAMGLLVGIAILGSGLYYLRGSPGGPGHDVPVIGTLFARVSRLLVSRIDRLAATPRIAGLGAIHGLLPCPILYPAYLYAFALGNPLRGGLSLAALGPGTVPALFVYGTLLGSLSPARRAHLHRALGVAFVVLAYVPLQHGLMSVGVHLPHPPIPFYQPL